MLFDCRGRLIGLGSVYIAAGVGEFVVLRGDGCMHAGCPAYCMNIQVDEKE